LESFGRTSGEAMTTIHGFDMNLTSIWKECADSGAIESVQNCGSAGLHGRLTHASERWRDDSNETGAPNLKSERPSFLQTCNPAILQPS
jgi:hypothetical protein